MTSFWRLLVETVSYKVRWKCNYLCTTVGSYLWMLLLESASVLLAIPAHEFYQRYAFSSQLLHANSVYNREHAIQWHSVRVLSTTRRLWNCRVSEVNVACRDAQTAILLRSKSPGKLSILKATQVDRKIDFFRLVVSDEIWKSSGHWQHLHLPSSSYSM